MKAMRKSLIAFALILGLSMPIALAGEAQEAEIDVLLDAIRANRKALIAANLPLSDDEAKKFWPVYDAYQAEMNGFQERIVALIEDYADNFKTMSDAKAMEIAKTYLAIEADRAKTRQSKLEAVAAALPGKKVARFYQIENKMDAIVRYKLAAGIPVVE